MPPAIPVATYRLQLTAKFDFDAAAAVVPYLKALGITHLYASPFMKARKGSTHGYDIVDHAQFNPELGGESGFQRLSAALQRHDFGLILDFVPNHVGVHFADNPWWLDTLEWGGSSPHAVSFDIDWEQLPYRARGGVLLPIIGSSYGEALEKGEIELRYDAGEGSFSAWYFEHRLPIAPERYSEILRTVVREAGIEDRPEGNHILALASRYKGLRHPNRNEAPAFKAELKAIDGGAALIARGLEAYRCGPERSVQTLALHHLLERQHYKLGHWRLASSDINYRRFFDVNTLAGLRVEDAGTFEAIHGLVRKLVAAGQLQGLRLDHIDGLRDPAQYFQRLRRLIRAAQGGAAAPFYMVIEKILGEHEALRPFADVQGTTGYEWLNAITRVLVDDRGLDALDEIWRQISNTSPRLDPVLKAAKRRVIDTLLTSEFTVLTRLLARIAAGHYSTRDFSADSLRQALELYVLHFPIYRTYLTAAAGATEHDHALIAATIDRARTDWFAADDGIFDFLRDALTMDLIKPGRGMHSAPRVRRFALKLQQFTGPVMAKSLEDTSFYRYHRLLAFNEVGGEPAARGLSIDAFHAAMSARVKEWPHGMTATATHDTKRGEDARARLLALAELPGEWASTVARWKILNAPHLVTGGEMRAPSAAFEYMLYQALIGAWPMGAADEQFLARMQAYALKAAREGKQETSWLNPNQAYEAGLQKFLARILDREVSAQFLEFAAGVEPSHGAARRAEFAQPAHAEGDDAWGARFLSGHRILGFVAGRSGQPATGRFHRAGRCAGASRSPGLGPPGAGLARWASQARLDAAPAETEDRNGRCVHTRRLPAAAGQRTAPRPCHCVCAPPRRSGRHRGGRQGVGAAIRRRPGLASRGGHRCLARPARLSRRRLRSARRRCRAAARRLVPPLSRCGAEGA